jgi:hypothetical protein
VSALEPGTRLSDQDLRRRLFTIGDPESLSDLADTIPSTDDVPEIEYAYDLTPNKSAPRRDFVFCAHCGHPTHYKGYVVRFKTCRCLIGKDCGFKYYGAEFHAIERGFLEERRRQINLLRLDDAVSELPHLLRSLNEIAETPGTRMFDEARNTMRAKMPDLWNALAGVADGTRDLTVTQQVRDYAAEEARDRNRRQEATIDDEEEEDEPIYRFDSRVIGPLNGAAFCRSGLGSALASFRGAHERHKEDYRRLRHLNTDRMSTRQLRTELNNLTNDLEKLRAYERPMLAVTSFFGPENLLRIAEWANSFTRDGRYGTREARLVFASGRQPPVEAVCPGGYTPPDLTGLRSFLTKLGLGGD